MKEIIVFALFLVIPIALRADSRVIHLIKIINTDDPSDNMDKTARLCERGIDREVLFIQNKLKLSGIKNYKFSGKSFNSKSIVKAIPEIQSLINDIFIILYVGHGIRDNNTLSYFPKLYLGNDAYLDFQRIQDMICKKKPSIVLSVVVACNYEPSNYNIAESPTPNNPNNTPSADEFAPGLRRSQLAYQRLFAPQSGVIKCIDFISSDIGYGTIINDGGIFFPQLLRTFEKYFSNNNTESWEVIGTEIVEKTVKASKNKQKPKFNYSHQFVNEIEIRGKKKSIISKAKGMFSKKTDCEKKVKETKKKFTEEEKKIKIKNKKYLKQKKKKTSKSELRNIERQLQVELLELKIEHENIIQRKLSICKKI